MTNEEILSRTPEFRYMLLGRMLSDCKYFLGYANGSEKVLWAGNAEEQGDIMILLYNSFNEDEKPEWTSLEEINDFKNKIVNFNK